MTEIKQYDFKREYSVFANEYEKKILEVLRSGWYTLGEELRQFEQAWADYNGAKYCIGVASGLDALQISLRLLGVGKGDEVIVPANTYIASVLAITLTGAEPVFVEPDEYFGIDPIQICGKITDRTKAVIAVHLYGMPCQMDTIMQICRQNHLFLVEDCAQAHGAEYKERRVGTFGDAGCYSFFPSKNLGAFGDGGCILTNNDKLADEARMYRNYGCKKRYHHEIKGINSRLDEMQAGLLRIKLEHLDYIISERKRIAGRYTDEIRNSCIILPKIREDVKSVWHQYVIRCEQRDDLMKYLSEKGVETYIHYPIPPHLSGAYKDMKFRRGDFLITEEYADTVLSLPLFLGMTDEEQGYVIDVLNHF